MRSQSAAAFFSPQVKMFSSAQKSSPYIPPSETLPNESIQVKLEKIEDTDNRDKEKRRRKKSKISTQLDSYLDKSPIFGSTNATKPKLHNNVSGNNNNTTHFTYQSSGKVSGNPSTSASANSSPVHSPQAHGFPSTVNRSFSGTTYTLPPLAISNTNRRNSYSVMNPSSVPNPKRMSSPTPPTNGGLSSILHSQNSYSILQT
jgi:hypothetical protein